MARRRFRRMGRLRAYGGRGYRRMGPRKRDIPLMSVYNIANIASSALIGPADPIAAAQASISAPENWKWVPENIARNLSANAMKIVPGVIAQIAGRALVRNRLPVYSGKKYRVTVF